MAWFKVDDTLAFNAKVVMAGNEAMGLWLRAGAWCASQLQDGFVPKVMAIAMANPMADGADIASLVTCGLWEEAPGGYRFHDWSEYQPSGEEVRAKRKARSEAGKRGADARWGANDDEAKPMANAMANAMANECPVPSRPVPLEKIAPRGARIAEDWQPSDSLIAWASKEAPNVDIETESASFVDYWIAKTGKDATKLDWDRTWKRWMRTAQGRIPEWKRNPKNNLTEWERSAAPQRPRIVGGTEWEQ